MPDPILRPPIAPPTAGKRMRAVMDVDGRLDDVDVLVIGRAKDVGDAPLAYLSHLAWERSVDVWDPAWPDEIKRQVVAAAPVVHRYKGTRHAVETALMALNVDSTIVEWWETDPQGIPYTFEVRARARGGLYDGVVLDERLIRVVIAAVLGAKPASRAFVLRIGASFPRPLGLAGVALGTTVVRRCVSPRLAARGARTLGLAGVALGRIVVRHGLRLKPA